MRVVLLVPKVTQLARFFISDPRGATFKLLPCLRGAATKWLRGGSATRDLLLQSSPIGQFVG